MTTKPFQIHPRTILGVERDASSDEIRAAFREKSKKYHPDLGGDEWAFRMVQDAYDLLRVPGTGEGSHEVGARHANATDPEPWIRHPSQNWRSGDPVSANGARPDAKDQKPEDELDPGSSWISQVWPNAVRWFHPRRKARSRKSGSNASARGKLDPSANAPRRRVPSAEAMLSFKTVEVDLIWIRFAMDQESARDKAAPLLRDGNDDDSTLSVCLVVSWPPASAVEFAADYPHAPETLRSIIEVFEGLKHGAGPSASRSKIEDGRFVGWLSYPDVIRAEAGFKRFREGVSLPGLSIRLRTRQEEVPVQWRDTHATRAGRNGHEPAVRS